MFITRNGMLEDVPFTKTDCVTQGFGHRWAQPLRGADEPNPCRGVGLGPRFHRCQADRRANLNMPMTRGVIWMEDVHYNANKFNNQGTHTFAWDNVGFDGPTPYRDLTFDVQDTARPTSATPSAPTPVASPRPVCTGCKPRPRPTSPSTGSLSPRACRACSVNGGPWHDTPWPFDSETYTERTIAIPIPLDEVSKVTTPSSSNGTASAHRVANINIVLIAASPVPT